MSITPCRVRREHTGILGAGASGWMSLGYAAISQNRTDLGHGVGRRGGVPPPSKPLSTGSRCSTGPIRSAQWKWPTPHRHPPAMRASEVQMLEVRGMVYVDVRRDSDVDATIAQLADDCPSTAMTPPSWQCTMLGRTHSISMTNTQPRAPSSAALRSNRLATNAERYRVSILRGNTLRTLGQAEAALPFLERGLDLAHDMHDDRRRPARHVLVGSHLHEYRQFGSRV